MKNVLRECLNKNVLVLYIKRSISQILRGYIISTTSKIFTYRMLKHESTRIEMNFFLCLVKMSWPRLAVLFDIADSAENYVKHKKIR